MRSGCMTLAAALLASLVAPAASDTFRANYALSIIGLSIGNAYATASLQPNAYKIDIGVKLGGVAALVTNAKGAATASGTIANNNVLPAAYANTSANSAAQAISDRPAGPPTSKRAAARPWK